MMRFLALFTFLMVSVMTSKTSVAIQCDDIVLAGKRTVEIDQHFLIFARWRRNLSDDEEFSLSTLLPSTTVSMTFHPNRDGADYLTRLESKSRGIETVSARISDGLRDGICALELWRLGENRSVSEYLQILAIYPDGELALGLPNRMDRQGLIMLGTSTSVR